MSAVDKRTSPLGIFERWLSLWVALAIIGGIILGKLAPDAIAEIAALEIASC
jgi:ACR3 family arsenite transporter